jgi:hypothetical protein
MKLLTAFATLGLCLAGSAFAQSGTEDENERQIRTFVVVKRDGRWRIMQDHNTAIRR